MQKVQKMSDHILESLQKARENINYYDGFLLLYKKVRRLVPFNQVTFLIPYAKDPCDQVGKIVIWQKDLWLIS